MTVHPGATMPATNRWVSLLLLIFAGFAVLTAWSFFRAARGASPVTDHSYYSHGLRFNQTLLEQKAAGTLGWQVEATLHGRRLQLLLTDQARQPVAAARATATVTGGARSEPLHLPLAEQAAGSYTLNLPDSLQGEVSALINFERDGARLDRQLLIALP
jgi:nitrogen fixation protein FixH